MLRLLFVKQGNAVWISHLDLMRVFQRAFKRSGLPLTHTQGFNPRPSVSIALPLSVGIESICELLDFELDGCNTTCEEIKNMLNDNLIEGVSVLDVYENGKKIRELAYLRSVISMEYDKGIPENAAIMIENLFKANEVLVEKKSKNGIQDQNIIPMIQSLVVTIPDENHILLEVVACCQNPSLNPMQLPAAVMRYLPEYAPDFSRCCRIEIFDHSMEIFR